MSSRSTDIEMNRSAAPHTPSRAPDPQNPPSDSTTPLQAQPTALDADTSITDMATRYPYQRPKGYPMLAGLMGRRPQMGIYRRFAYLNAQNLLYMQAELVVLENQLKEVQDQDAEIKGNSSTEDMAEDSPLRRAFDWETLSRAIQSGGHCGKSGSEAHPEEAIHEQERCEEFCEQWRLSMKIREKLHRYSRSLLVFPTFPRTVADPMLNVYLDETLIQQMTLASAGSPGPYDLEWVQHFLTSSTFMKESPLRGKDQNVWGRKAEQGNIKPCYDLITLIPQPKLDLFREWINKRLVGWLLNSTPRWGDSASPNYLKDKTLLGWTMVITSTVTWSLPILSIVVLHFAKGSNVRLGLLVVFNVLVAFVLSIFTDAQPMQVFAASAAYSAVNVIFVSSNATAST